MENIRLFATKKQMQEYADKLTANHKDISYMTYTKIKRNYALIWDLAE